MRKLVFLLSLAACLILVGCRKRSRTTTTMAPSGMQILEGICLPRQTDRLVYRHRNETHVYIAFDVLKKGKVDLYWWDVLKASNETVISGMTEEIVLPVDFRKTVNRNHIVGATGKRHHKKFRQKIRRQMRGCRRKRCHVRSIMGVFVRLAGKIRNVRFNTEDCNY